VPEDRKKSILGAICRLGLCPCLAFSQKILLLFYGSLMRANVMKNRNCTVNGPLLIPQCPCGHVRP